MDLEKVIKELVLSGGILYKENVSLKKYNTYKLNAISKHFLMPENIDSLAKIKKTFDDKSIDYLVLGGGSNILFVDNVINMPIIFMGFFSRVETVSQTKILAYSFASTHDVVKFSLKHSLTGLEFLSGLPGSIGGATYMNARCFDYSLSQFVESVGVIDENGDYFHIPKSECDFKYKKSIFQNKNYIIVDITFDLLNGKKKLIKCLIKKKV